MLCFVSPALLFHRSLAPTFTAIIAWFAAKFAPFGPTVVCFLLNSAVHCSVLIAVFY
jgi:hypothetical protein